jgi:hypothetical protein
MSLIRKNRTDAHWSKDYIEHLRTVHFLLVAAAITAIALSRVPSGHDLRIAQHQIHTIRQEVAQQATFHEQKRKPIMPSSYLKWNFLLLEIPPDKYFVEEMHRYETTKSCSNKKRLYGYPEYSLFAAIRNLQEFIAWRQFVSCLERTAWEVVDIASVVQFRYEAVFVLKRRIAKADDLLKDGYKYRELALRTNAVEGELEDDASSIQDLRFVPTGISVSQQQRQLELNALTFDLEPDQSDFSDRKPIEILIHSVPRDSRKSYDGGSFDENSQCHDSFEKCYPELNRIAGERATYPLKDLTDAIDAEVAASERQFELFGVKFPREDLSLWGIIVVVVVLGYFCIHLQELSPRIESTDAGLEVAWLGLYSSWYSRALFWLSVLLLPCMAILLLGLKGARYEGPLSESMKSHWRNLGMWIAFPVVVSVALGSFSCLAATRLAALAAYTRHCGESESKFNPPA